MKLSEKLAADGASSENVAAAQSLETRIKDLEDSCNCALTCLEGCDCKSSAIYELRTALHLPPAD